MTQKYTFFPNRVQRSGLFVYMALVLIVLFLHFPFGEYFNIRTVVIRQGQGQCPVARTHEELSKWTAEQFRQSMICQDQTEDQFAPFLEWQSDEPIIAWFGPISHVLASVLLLTLLTALLLWAVKTPNASQEKSAT